MAKSQMDDIRKGSVKLSAGIRGFPVCFSVIHFHFTDPFGCGKCVIGFDFLPDIFEIGKADYVLVVANSVPSCCNSSRVSLRFMIVFELQGLCKLFRFPPLRTHSPGW